MAVILATANGTPIAGTDYRSASGTLNWAAGDGAAKTFSMPIINRGGNLAERKFTVTLSSPTGAAFGALSTVTITIHN